MRGRRDISRVKNRLRRRKVQLPRRSRAKKLTSARTGIPTIADRRTRHVVSIERNLSDALSAMRDGVLASELLGSRDAAKDSLNFLLEYGKLSPNQIRLCNRLIGILEENFTDRGVVEFLSLSCGLKDNTI